ncbi:hypothetical protein [Fibrobacter sp. UWEL]|uniref:hypothetical protein n=1 Tax=Fibrobacter sp. UWEL TaxID=1896209 RepID=UPI00091A8E96|nr:hypothetical protein [Fibrobacter sp. UWEL]SHL16939.1 hypothetical protein SAMN05720468_11568 [Fibrobacter sp. UWEL]
MKTLFPILCVSASAFAAPVELCVSFECENCFSVHVMKAESVENPQWMFKDSVECECGMWLAPSFEIPDWPEALPSGAGGLCASIGKKESVIKMPPVPEIKLKEGNIVYSAYISDNKQEVTSKFKHDVDLLWKTRFICQGNLSKDTTLVYKIKANLVGECSSKK